jgi:hypothetical protein
VAAQFVNADALHVFSRAMALIPEKDRGARWERTVDIKDEEMRHSFLSKGATHWDTTAHGRQSARRGVSRRRRNDSGVFHLGWRGGGQDHCIA